MKRIIFTLLSCMVMAAAHAKIEPGKVYAIALASDTTKTLFVENSSLGDARVVLWTDTHVPAQQWEAVKSTDGNTYSFRNLYTGKYLSYANASGLNSEINQVGVVSPKTKWLLRSVDAENNIYRLRIAGCTLDVAGTLDGNRPCLKNNDATAANQEWRLLEIENPIREFNATARDEMMNAYLKQFIQVHGNDYLSFGNGGWGECEMMEVILDAYEETGQDIYKKMFEKMYAYFKQGVGEDWTGGGRNGYAWYGYDFNDDVAWMLITAARAGCLFNDESYSRSAKYNFDLIYKRAYVPNVGLLRWAQYAGVGDDGSFSINSCINGPMEVAACYIGKGLNDESYFEKARNLYAQHRVRLADMNTGKVIDCFRVNRDCIPNGETNQWSSTYNQGTMMGAAVLLYDHYKDEQYKEDAKKIMEYTKQNLCNGYGVISVCQTVKGDLCGFKGILMRYVRRLVLDCGATEYLSWMKTNAWQAYNNRNAAGYTHSAWLTKSAENLRYGTDSYDVEPFGCSTALSAAFNVPLNVGEEPMPVDAPHVIEAEFATLKGGSKIVRDRYSSSGMYVGNVGNGSTVEFDFEAPQAGVYDMTIYYMSEDGRWMYVAANDDLKTLVRYRLSGSWNALSQSIQTVQLTLKQGMNHIVLGNNIGYCPNLDKFEIAFNEDATGIRTVDTEQLRQTDDRWFNLKGEQVVPGRLQRGIYVHQGRKVVVK